MAAKKKKEKKNLDEIKTEILSRINIQAEYDSFGIESSGTPNSAGWVACHSPYNKDAHPSCGFNVGSGPHRGYLCAFNQVDGKGVKPYMAYSFWDIARDFMPESRGSFKVVLRYYAKKTGVKLGKRSSPPTEKMVEDFHSDLISKYPDALEHMRTKRGLSDESLKKYKIGFRNQDKRNSFPVYDKSGDLVNIRYHNSKKQPKTLNHQGYGEKRLWGVDRITKADKGSKICVTEGEFDSILVEQETGLISVSPTNGTTAFSHEWAENFHGYHVCIVWDCDKEGRDAIEKIVLPAFRKSVESGAILSLKLIWLFPGDAPKKQKDFTDFIIKAGGSGDDLLKMIRDTEPYEYPKQSGPPLPDPDLFFEGSTLIPSDVIDYLTEFYDLIHDGATYYQYNHDKGVWVSIPKEIVKQYIQRALGRRFKKIYIADIEFNLQAYVYKSPEELKTPPNLINMTNGVLDIGTGRLLFHNKNHYLRTQLPIEFDPKAKCKRFLQFLSEVFPDDIGKAKALQDFAGYCFYPEPFLEKCFFLIGTGANGKSVFLNVLTKIIGLANICSLDPVDFSNLFMLGTLKDKLLNISTEVETKEHIQSNQFKKIISGDLVQADKKHCEPFTFFPTAKHIFSMNEIPVITDKTFAFQRRLIVIRFNQTFSGDKADHLLSKKLESELSGIFNWALLGLTRVVNQDRITESKSMVKSKNEFLRQINPVLTFAEEQLEFRDGLYINKTDLYKDYKAWSLESGLRPLSKPRFYTQFLVDFQNVQEDKIKHGKRFYKNVDLVYQGEI